jgi:hypothetical protein
MTSPGPSSRNKILGRLGVRGDFMAQTSSDDVRITSLFMLRSDLDSVRWTLVRVCRKTGHYNRFRCHGR